MTTDDGTEASRMAAGGDAETGIVADRPPTGTEALAWAADAYETTSPRGRRGAASSSPPR
jgi:hypothetical protein